MDLVAHARDVEWMTPPWLLELVRAVSADRKIWLDPCTPPSNPCGALAFYSLPDHDGLIRAWHFDVARNALVYVNPPYSRQDNPRWAEKIAKEAAQGLEIIALLPVRTDTAWWHLVAPRADAVCFLAGRPRFFRPGDTGYAGAGKVPIAVLYFGDRAKVFARVFAPHGWIPGHQQQSGEPTNSPRRKRLGRLPQTDPASAAGPLTGAREPDHQQPLASRASESGP